MQVNNQMLTNPIMELINLNRNGGNLMPVFQQMAGRNPQMGQFLQMVVGKNSQQIRQSAINAARERGIDIGKFIQQNNIPIQHI